ncbi:hypothetical protein F4775DRAFT_514409 [Biscogniauxia sp. FL1348]|nr:hypothetical protein F4775DRAFT_514409 [Biscogniauxia sp. FL1348]
MASLDPSEQPAEVSLESYDTALCIIPPSEFCASIDRLRSVYDKAYQKWPPHMNLVYPFVHPEILPRAAGLITTHLQSWKKEIGDVGLDVELGPADVFPHKHDNTIFIYDNDDGRASKLDALRKAIFRALGHTPTNSRMHMTIGQSEELDSAPHKFLLEKASLLPSVGWNVDKLYILVRERMQIDGKGTSRMKVWGTINLAPFALSKTETPTPLYEDKLNAVLDQETTYATLGDLPSRRPYIYNSAEGKWIPHQNSSSQGPRKSLPNSLTISSYNVLAEFHYPPSEARYPIIIQNLLHRGALADILVLEEVTDHFLSYLSKNDEIREQYPFITNGPPDQSDLGPLPNHLNIVVLSKWAFSWDWVPFRRRHKGSVILRFDEIGKHNGDDFIPAILATVHLTHGLTDGSVSAKKLELQTLINHLANTFPHHPWILAGDFNITTSSYTINAALKKKAISSQTASYLGALETMATDAGLVDAWAFARVHSGDFSEFDQDPARLEDAFEGEQGATMDPTVNELAAENMGSGFNNRPQRYDRILVKSRDLFSITRFNMFGKSLGILGGEQGQTNKKEEDLQESKTSYGSDHWGVRCSLKIMSDESDRPSDDPNKHSPPVNLVTVPESLADTSELRECLAERKVFPSEEDIFKRKEALELLKSIVLENGSLQTRGKPAFVLVPVGSYGLGVWTPSSDVDCLCIGPVSPKTFFALATQRLRKAAPRGVKLLRRVNANSGTMLELEVQDIKMDLQYCPSTYIAETWPYAMQLPPTDPIFSLSTQTLAKLKPVRDLYYLRRTIPDYAAFRIAYQLIKSWAKQRGIYAAKFGYLGGIHISILLSRVCKLLSHDGRSTSVPAILITFFNHYANFDWKTQLAFDPFFHKHLRYVRTTREPMAILGFHAPNLNTAHTASLPSVRTISEEFKRADSLLSQDGMSWSRFLGEDRGAAEFLASYKSYVKIDVQFWGVSLAKGSSFVGWLESRCVMLLVDLNRRLPNIHARIWPARFVDEEASSEEDTDYQGHYLVGLDKWETANGQPMTKDDTKAALGSLQTALQKFETQIRSDEKYFDAKSSWMSASVVKQSELGSLRLDGREWGEYTIGEDESEDEEEEEEEEDPFAQDEADDSGADVPTTGRSRSKKPAVPANLPTRPAYEGKFRSSADVINRLRWDPSMDSSDYIVGYEDRFLGAKERALDLWKTEQTDEEFIPQHRILYFKRRSDGAIVWDRKERRDAIFGSGFGDGGGSGDVA